MSLDSFVYREVDSKYFEYPAKILSIDYYEEDSAGEHDFSRKQVWFYVYGDDEIKQEFVNDFSTIYETLFSEHEDYWDFVTLMPSHGKASFNPNMEELLTEFSEEVGLEFRQILHRNHDIRDNHELDNLKEKVINSESSINLRGDVQGKNILLVDNISLTGCSFMHAVELLKRNGANNVVCMALGVDTNGSSDLTFDESSSDKILEKLEIETED